MRVAIRALICFSLTVAAADLMLAQAVSGNLGGTVRDATGAGVPNAPITITDIDRGTVYHIDSGQDGTYAQTHLLAGHYRVDVQSQGFGTFSATAIVEV